MERVAMAENTLPLFANAGKFYVYIYRDPRPRKKLAPIYIGKGIAARRRADFHWNGTSKNTLFARILGKCRDLGLEPIIEIVAWFDDESAAFDLEIALIKKFGRRNLGLGPLTNLTDGGEGVSGQVFSAEHRAKMSAARLGKKLPDDQREKMIAGIRKKFADPEYKARWMETIQAANQTPEAREKQSIAMRVSTACLANLAALAKANLGSKRSPEIRAKMTAAQFKRFESLDERKKIGAAKAGTTHTAETKAKISASKSGKTISEVTRRQRLGRKQSAETVEKRAAAVCGCKHPPRSPEWIERQRIAQTGRPKTDAERAKISAAGRARPPISEETRAKMSAAKRARIVTDETKAKLSAAHTGRKRAPYSDETKALMSASAKARRARERAERLAQT
jgi:hypothetical protein